MDFEKVRSLFQVSREVVVEGNVSIGSVAELLAVEEDGGVSIDAVEVDGDFFPCKVVGEFEFLSVVADAADAIAAVVFLRTVFARAHFPRPVVGEGDSLPVVLLLIAK